MSGCTPTIEVSASTTIIVVSGGGIPAVVETGGDPVVLVAQTSTIDVSVDQDAPVVIECCTQGPAGPPGDTGPQGPPGAGIPIGNFKDDVVPDGAVNGTNTVFTLPGGDTAYHFAVGSGPRIKVYLNGVRLTEGVTCDFIVLESGGVGTGHDTIQFTFAPIGSQRPSHAGDQIKVDYICLVT